QRVADLVQLGGNAEYVCRPASGLIPVPESVDAAEAVCLVLSYMTAYQMLWHAAGVRRGQKVLVQGGSGAVGTALLQLGRQAGLEVVATASDEKLDLLESFGATAIDYRASDYDERLRKAAGEGFDAAFDAIGLASFRRSHRLLKRGGALVTYGTFGAAGAIDRRTPLKFLAFGLNFFAMLVALRLWSLLPDRRAARFFGIVDSRKDYPQRFVEDLDYLFALLAVGQLNPVIAGRLSLDEATRAHEMIDAGSVRGQLVFVMEPVSS
ncbi:MAG: zinc-binding dehydrogenase, partial [Rubrobacter sp.]